MTVAELRELLAALPGDGPVLVARGAPRDGLDAVASVVLARRMVHSRGAWWVDRQPEPPAASLEADAGPPVVALLIGVAGDAE